MLMSAWMAALLFAQDPRIKLVEVDRLVLKNGSWVDGTVIGTNEDEVILKVKNGLLGVRKELILQRERVSLKIKVAPEAPRPSFFNAEARIPPRPSKPETPGPETPVTPVAPKPRPPLDLKQFGDPDAAVRKKVEDLLKELAEAADNDKQSVAEKIANLGTDAQIYIVAALLSMEEFAPFLLMAVGRYDGPAGLPELSKLLPSVSEKTAMMIMSVLGSRGYREGATEFLPFLEHKNPMVRGTAVQSLADLKATEYFPKLMSMLGSKDQALSSRVLGGLETMARLPDFKDQAIPMILDAIRSSQDARAKAQAAMLAGQLQIVEGRDSITELLQNDSAEVRAMAVQALGEMKDPSVVQPLVDAMILERDRWTKVQMIQALEKIKSYDAIQPLIECLGDTDDQIRSRAATALTNITNQPFGEDQAKWEEWNRSR
jgi:HEAT repeat protein